MSDTPQSGDGERTNLAPILAPIITLFIGFGAGVVFSEFIPLGKTPAIKTGPGASTSTGPSDRQRPAHAEQQMDAETQRAIEEAEAAGEETAEEALDQATPPSDDIGGG